MSQSNYPVADIKLSEYAFCKFFEDDNISPNKQGAYVLEASSLVSTCAETDSRMVTVDSLN